MPKLKIFLVLALFCNLWAIPFNIESVKDGQGDEIRKGQLIKVHFKGYLILDSLQMEEMRMTEAQQPGYVHLLGR